MHVLTGYGFFRNWYVIAAVVDIIVGQHRGAGDASQDLLAQHQKHPRHLGDKDVHGALKEKL